MVCKRQVKTVARNYRFRFLRNRVLANTDEASVWLLHNSNLRSRFGLLQVHVSNLSASADTGADPIYNAFSLVPHAVETVFHGRGNIASPRHRKLSRSRIQYACLAANAVDVINAVSTSGRMAFIAFIALSAYRR